MIGFDRNTGRTIDGWEQFVSRVQQVMTTPIGGREKRRTVFGSRVPETLGKNMSGELLLLAQTYAIDAFYNQDNGINDYQPTRCIARRRDDGITLFFEGNWHGQSRNFEVAA